MALTLKQTGTGMTWTSGKKEDEETIQATGALKTPAQSAQNTKTETWRVGNLTLTRTVSDTASGETATSASKTAAKPVKAMTDDSVSSSSGKSIGGAGEKTVNKAAGLGAAGDYSLAEGVQGVVQKGLSQVAQAGGAAGALAEDILFAPMELLSGQELGAISDTGLLNRWNDSIKQEAAAVQEHYAGNVAAGGKAAEVFDTLGTATVAAVPQAVAAMLTGGVSAAATTTAGLQRAAANVVSPGVANTVSNVVSSLSRDPQYWLSFSQTVGASYENALADMAEKGGVDNNTARTKAALQAIGSGLINAAIESSGGIQQLPEQLRQGGGVWKSIVESAVDEGKEEVLQGIIDRATQNLVYNKGNALASVTDKDAVFSLSGAAEEFAGGAVVGGLLSGGQAAANSALNAAQNGAGRTSGQNPAEIPQQQVSEGNSSSAVQNAAQGNSGDIMEAEVQRLYGQQKTAPEEGAESTAIDDSPARHTPQEQAVIEAYKQSRDDKLRSFIERVRTLVSNDYRNKIRTTIDVRSSRAVEKAGELTGVDTTGYTPIIKGNAVQHIDRRHGAQGKADQSMANLDDFSRIGFVLDNFTNAEIITAAEIDEETARLSREWMNSDNTHAAMVRFSMPVNGIYYVVEAVPSSNAKVMAVVSAYMEKGAKKRNPPQSSAEHAADTNSQPPQLTPEAPHEMLEDSNKKIPQTTPEVKADPLLTAMLNSQRKDDGLGAADAGSLNSDYDRLQAESDTFHPEGANAARPVDVPTRDFDGRNIPKSTSTIMGAQGIDGEDVRFLEQQIADGKLSFDTIKDSDAVARAQTVIQDKGFDGALEQYRQAVSSGVATKDNTCLGQQLLLQAMKSGNAAYTAELLSLYTRNSTTAAQAMQAQSIFRKLSPEGQLVAVQKAIDALNEKYGTDHQISPEAVETFLNAETDEARQEAEARIVKEAAQAIPGTFKARFDALRYLAMLGNPRTHIRNILGNTLFQAPVAIKNRVGAVLEGGAYLASGGRVERTKSLFGANPLGKLATEARADWKNVKDFLSQSGKYSDGQTGLLDIEQEAHAFSDSNPVGRTVNRLSDFNSRALEAEDTAAKRIIYAQSLAGYLRANGVKSMEDADPALLNRARTCAANEALRNTFNDRNAVSDAVSKLGAASRSSNPVVKTAGYVVEGVLPFKRTPANILVRAAEYSPVGMGIGIFDTIRGSTKGDADAVSRGLDRLAAGMTGTGMMALGVLAAGNGWVTGGEDDDDEQQAFDDLTGHQTYALELADGTSVTLEWLAPEAIPFFMGVELCRAAENGQLTIGELGDTLKNATAPMLEMSMLQGLSDTFDNAAYAINRGESVIGSLVTSALTNYVTQVVPTLGGQLERTGEDVRMSTYTDKNSPLSSDLQYTLGKVSQKVPGWDFQQIPYIDAWGREEATGDVLERSVNNLFNPAYVSQVEVDAVEAELQRLADSTGSTSVFPDRAGKYITVNGTRKDLSAEEYVKYAKVLGQERYQLAQKAIASDAYGFMSSGERAEFISTMYRVAGYKAAKEIDASYENDALRKYAEAEAAGMSPVDYYVMRQTYDYDGSSSTGQPTQAEAQRYLDTETDLTQSQKADLWTIINQSWKNNPYQ